MVITGLFRATRRLPRGRTGAVLAASAVPLAAVLLAGCGGGDGAQQVAARAQASSAEAAVRTMRVEKHYKDPKGNRFAVEVAIGPIKDRGVCGDLSPDDTYSHSLLLTITSQTAKSKEVRLPRIAVEDRAVTFTASDNSGIVCSTVVSDSDKTVLHGGQIKEIEALVSRPRDPSGDLVLTVWPPGKPQTELIRIPFRSLP